MKHTKGPWKINTIYTTFFQIDSENNDICCVDCDFNYMLEIEPTQEQIANARLISCAPEMLEALIIQYEWLYSKAYYNTCESIKSVIEKATGMKIEEVLKNEGR
jgi:hypothetical protein